jgi:transposase
MIYKVVLAFAVIMTAQAAPAGLALEPQASSEPPSKVSSKKEAIYEKRCDEWMLANGYTGDHAKEVCAKDAGAWAQKKECISSMRAEGDHSTAEIKKACQSEIDSERQLRTLQCRKDQRAKGVHDKAAIKAACHPTAAEGKEGDSEPVASPATAAETELIAEPAASSAPSGLTPGEEKKMAGKEKRCESFMASNGYSADEAKEQCAKDAGEWIQKKICVTEMRKEGGHTTAEIKEACKDEADSERVAAGTQCRKEQRAKGVTNREEIKEACKHLPSAEGKKAAEPAASSAPAQ